MYFNTIDDIFKCLEELEDQGHLSVTAENQIQTLKFQLRFVRMVLKWRKDFHPVGLEDIRTWIIDIKKRLFQPTRKVSTAPDLLEKRLSSLLQIMEQLMSKKPTTDYGEFEAWYGLNLADKNLVIDELVRECIDPLLEHLLRCNDLNLLVFSNEQIQALIGKLRSLRNFLEITGIELKKALKNPAPRQNVLHLMTRIEVIIHNALYLSWHAWAKGNQKRMEELLSHLLVKINHIEPEIRMIYVQLLKASKLSNPHTLGIDIQALAAVDSLLKNLQKLLKYKDTGSIMKLDIHQIDSLHQELSFLKYFLMDSDLKYIENGPHIFNSLLTQVEAMAREGAAITHLICVGQAKDHMVNVINLLHSDLLKIVHLLKAEIRQMYLRIPKPSTLSFPQTPKLSFLDFFLQRLDELLKHRADSITYVKNEIEIVQIELGSLNFFVNDIIKKSEHEDETIARLVVDAAYEAELVIDLISASNLPSWYYMLWLFDVIEKLKMLRKECTELCIKKTCEINMLNVETDSIHGSPHAYTLAAEGEAVGFNDEAKNIIDRLTRGSEKLEIVSIVGMPGLGKTTLAKKVYEHPSVTSYFHVRAWYYISQVYERRDLLVSILSDVIELREEIREMDNEDMAEVLYRSLKGRRYLIVIDDIWNISPWNDIRHSFPDDCNGSRILFTTRIREVALQANHRSAPHDLRLFKDEESLELLQNKVFKQRSCPAELHKIGKEIAKNCKGLPLSVVVIAGVLIKLEESEDHWREVSESMDKQVGDSSKCVDVLELSYRHLPDHLKPCFLYLGAFPEDEEIPTWKLIRLWIAEGFIRNSKSESLENVAEGYLMDLIARSLVLVDKNKSNGGVKSCRVHDLLHEFSLNKAKHENFLQISREMVNPEQYRHCFYCKKDSLHGWRPHNPYVRSVFVFPTERAVIHLYNSRHIDLSVLPYLLKLLRVLDLVRIPLRKSKFPAEIQLLVHLRYLAIQGRLNRVPSSVGKLWRLETFLMVGTFGKVQLPGTLLEMKYLKHVYVSDEATFVLPIAFQPEKCFESDGIEKFSTLSLRYGDGTTEKVISSLRIRSLRKLKCIFLESWDYNRHCNQFPVLDLLNKLESLNVTYHGKVRVQHECILSFPSNLKKLTLSNFHLPWSEISKIGKLPQLEILKLRFWAFDGRRWDVNEKEFCNLKVLKLENLNIMEWYASPDAFPCLEQLVLQRCKQLEEIPSSFGELDTLRIIEVQWCSYSVTKAVRKIQEEQEDLQGADGLKVLIQPTDWDSATAS